MEFTRQNWSEPPVPVILSLPGFCAAATVRLKSIRTACPCHSERQRRIYIARRLARPDRGFFAVAQNDRAREYLPVLLVKIHHRPLKSIASTRAKRRHT